MKEVGTGPWIAARPRLACGGLICPAPAHRPVTGKTPVPNVNSPQCRHRRREHSLTTCGSTELNRKLRNGARTATTRRSLRAPVSSMPQPDRELVCIAARRHKSRRIIACQTQNRRARAQCPPRARPFTGMFGCSFRRRRQHASSSARANACVASSCKEAIDLGVPNGAFLTARTIAAKRFGVC